jgi:RNA polymerase sigma-70 factor (ECF subfamily)
MQVTYLEAFLRIGDFAPGGPNAFPAWLRRIALNNVKDGVRELQRDKRLPPARRIQAGSNDSYAALAEDLACESLTPSRDASKRELRDRIEALLRELPRDYSDVVRLACLEGLTGPETAERMNRSLGAVKMLLLRARTRLRELLGSPSRFLSGQA